MNFDHTEDRRMLSDMLRRFVAEQYGFAVRDDIARSSQGYSADFWRRYAELGAIGALFPEDDGGLGGAGFDIAVVFEALGRNPAGGKLNIIAHSMGALLTLETLRQLWALSGSTDLAARIGAIVLAAPDIDVDLFATSLKRIGPLASHITVIGSTKDRALAVSGQLAGGVSRVGASVRRSSPTRA